MFRSTFNRGFQMTFGNNLTISVQWGTGNYCERKKGIYLSTELRESIIESKDAEIAIWENEGSKRFLDFGSNQVKGYCSADEVGKWITATCECDSLEELQSLVSLDNLN